MAPGPTEPRIGRADPADPGVAALIEAAVARSRALYEPDASHALDAAGLAGLPLYAARGADGTPVAICALRPLGAGEAELKSMFVAPAARGSGLGRAMLAHVVAEARAVGHRRLRLETGTDPDSAPARALYEAAGFRPTGPFADYAAHPDSAFYARNLAD